MADDNPGHQCDQCKWFNGPDAASLARHKERYHKEKKNNDNPKKKPGN